MSDGILKFFADCSVEAVRQITGIEPKPKDEQTQLHFHQYNDDKANEAIRRINYLEAKLNSQRK